MADIITPVIGILDRLFGCCSKWTDSIRRLGDNLNPLRSASEILNGRYLDVKRKVETAEKNPDPKLMVLNEVRVWMDGVENLQKEVQDILQRGDQEKQAKCFGCPKNCRARYKLHKMVTRKLNDVNRLLNRGNFDHVAEKCAGDQFVELPVDEAVGVESTFEELRTCFENNQVGVIGLHGMGAVGKTTLLKKFNNDFLSTRADYVVIWVVASKDVYPGRIQDAIRRKLRVEDDSWNNATMDERPSLLLNILNKKKFVLLLDDVWERIDLWKLGVPSPNNCECKIIFTTRSKEICGLMGAQRHIKVNCLPPDRAFELFKKTVGTTILENPYISDLAKLVVDECQGLPLALRIIGRVMVNKVSPAEWKRAIEILRSYPSKIQVMVEDVYCLLKFSYDRLPNDTYKLCLLYCALFPEDYNIEKEDLVFLWTAEGYLVEFDYTHEAHKHGEDIISGLSYACLLENGDKENTIKMHDVIRDMALWIACEEQARFIVKDGYGTTGLGGFSHTKLKQVEKLSLWSNGHMILNPLQTPHCPNLITLLIRNTSIEVFPTEVLVLPNTIRVLDLSFNDGIRNLPSAIGDFVNLEHMNLSHTNISKLPEEFKNLKKLRFLLLDGLAELKLPQEVISSLLSLQAFSMRGWKVRVIMIDENVWLREGEGENVLLHELEGLNDLHYIRISVSSISSVKNILRSPKLQMCMCELFIKANSLLPDLSSSLGEMTHLETLKVMGVVKPENFEAVNIPRSPFRGNEYKISLRQLIIFECQNILDLNWLIYACDLEVLELSRCHSLKEVISADFGTIGAENNLFSSLTNLHLGSLSDLQSICTMALQFPSLKEIRVQEWPNLKKLPFNSQSVLKNLQSFKGEHEWLAQLQWEDEATRLLLSSKFERN
ncbi:probable disease resistance protein At5g63020 [Neltuma alba]|uniref:probable disease resistance protein At5g63020 n=1 Tax=Neltuma alba TaxID=207710 RepID=UPI0010A4DF97|nr:probable disease resistance protein At5g63020 [Prosopis alba]